MISYCFLHGFEFRHVITQGFRVLFTLQFHLLLIEKERREMVLSLVLKFYISWIPIPFSSLLTVSSLSPLPKDDNTCPQANLILKVMGRIVEKKKLANQVKLLGCQCYCYHKHKSSFSAERDFKTNLEVWSTLGNFWSHHFNCLSINS